MAQRGPGQDTWANPHTSTPDVHAREDEQSSTNETNYDRQHAVPNTAKRACSDCRKQKLRCDVVRSPFTPCSRCRRLGKNCVIDTASANKLDKYAFMQREIDNLRRKLRLATESGSTSTEPQSLGTEPSPSDVSASRNLGSTSTSGAVLDDLYKEFFTSYHPFLPFLDPAQKPDQYFELCPLLGWSIIIVAARHFKQEPKLLSSLRAEFVKLMWATIGDMPPSYHVAKALCLICFWPLPTNGGTRDASFQLSGILMQIAVQNMLHLPFRTPAPDETQALKAEQRDRLVTWITCNIVAECTSIVYGFPPPSRCEWIRGLDLQLLSYQIPKDLLHQLKISQFCNTFANAFYCNNSDSCGLPPEESRVNALDALRKAYTELETKLLGGSEITQLLLLTAHIHLNAF
ncbi:Regulatory protein LEU3, partial [Lachnellula suecica]